MEFPADSIIQNNTENNNFNQIDRWMDELSLSASAYPPFETTSTSSPSIQFPSIATTFSSKMDLPTTTMAPVPDYSVGQSAAMYCLNILELLGHLLLDCPVSALNFWLILQTAILHPNLKFILLCQSTCIFVRGVARMPLNWMRIFVDLQIPISLIWSVIYTFPVFMRNFLAHVLVIERALATILVRTYEYSRKPYFSLLWFFIVITLTSLEIFDADANVRLALVIFTAVLVLLEMLIFTWIWKYNDGIYNRMFFNMHSLSERYQLSENIRTGKQLIPTLILYFINIAIDTVVVTLGFYRGLGPARFNYDFILQLAYCIGTGVNFLIELSMLIYHPFLRRDFYRLWRKIAKKFGNTIVPTADAEGRRESALALRNMHGQQLILDRNEEAEGHFNHLNKAWGVGVHKPKMSL